MLSGWADGNRPSVLSVTAESLGSWCQPRFLASMHSMDKCLKGTYSVSSTEQAARETVG